MVSGVAEELGFFDNTGNYSSNDRESFQKTRNLSTAVRTSYVTDILTKLVDGITDLEIYLLIVHLTKSTD